MFSEMKFDKTIIQNPKKNDCSRSLLSHENVIQFPYLIRLTNYAILINFSVTIHDT